MRIALTVVRGPGTGRVMEFNEPRGFIIGRAADADFRLPPDDPFVSRRHVFMEICPPSCRLKDLGIAGVGSTNTPLLNGAPVTEADLKDGDLLELGYTQFKVSVGVDRPAQLSRPCQSCGKPIEFLAGEAEPTTCSACVEKEKNPVAPVAVTNIVCSQCRTDLSSQGNSDGRAQDLGTSVTYLCEKCLPKGDEFAGTSIGEYRILKRLGLGGMGVVFLAYCRRTARLCAVKQLKDLTDPLLIKRFEREMRLHKSLVHRNVARCFETGIDAKGAPFVVTEYVPGGDLSKWYLETGGKLPQSSAVSLVCAVLDGLEFLHSKEIVHRDIKLENILVDGMADRSGAGSSTPIPKITDFGLAKCYGEAGGTPLTRPRTGMGTMMYMPPEQIQDARGVREPADLYSTGTMLYYLLTGRYTFDFPTPQEVRNLQQEKPELWNKPQEALRLIMQLNRIRHPFNIILEEDPTPIRKRQPSIPPALAEVVDRAVKKDAKARFQSASEFRDALRLAT